MENHQIYISYRRDSGDIIAVRLYDALTSLGYTVFFDVESMHCGTVTKAVCEAIDGCQDFLLILSPHALDRCADVSDWMRIEIELAIEKKKNIIPIMTHSFSFPENLPSQLVSLQHYQGHRISVEYWSAFIDNLQRSLSAEISSPDAATVTPYRRDKKFIFISYAHKDSQQVLPIVAYLHNHGYRVWYDEGIVPGTEWDKEIADHIVSCGYFIAFISRNYLESSNCKDELNFARDLEKNRFLVYIEKVQLPAEMQMRMSRIQNIHKYAYADEDRFFDKLLQADCFHEYKD